MTATQANGTTTITGSGNTPQTIIDAGFATKSGNKTIVLLTHLHVNGSYNDTGWHYEMADGKRFSIGADCNWTSGADYFGFRVAGFTASIDKLGHSWEFNAVDGGSVTWRNVVITTRTSARSDFYIKGDKTNYDIDGFLYDSRAGKFENTTTDFNTGSMKNINFIRTNHVIGGTGTIENFGHSGLLEGGAENKIFPTDNNYHFDKYKPFIQSDGKRIATGFHAISVSAGEEKRIYFDNPIVPSYWDSTTDIVAYAGPGSIIVQRTFDVKLRDSSSNALSDVRVILKNTSDNTDSVDDIFSNEINQLVPVYIGKKTGGGGYSIPNVRKDHQEKDAYFIKYGKLISTILKIDMKAFAYSGSVFMLNDESITESNIANVEAYTNLNTAQILYDYAVFVLTKIATTEKDFYLKRTGNLISADGTKIHLSPSLTFPDFLTSASYSQNDKAKFTDGIIYKAKEAITAGAFDTTKWTKIGLPAFIIENGDITIQCSSQSADFDLGDTGELTSNGVTHSGTVSDKNGDSNLIFENIVSWELFNSSADRNINQNKVASGLGSVAYRFTYQDQLSYFLKLVVGSEVIFKDVFPSQKGTTVVSLSTAGLLGGISGAVADNKKVIDEIKTGVDRVRETQTTKQDIYKTVHHIITKSNFALVKGTLTNGHYEFVNNEIELSLNVDAGDIVDLLELEDVELIAGDVTDLALKYYATKDDATEKLVASYTNGSGYINSDNWGLPWSTSVGKKDLTGFQGFSSFRVVLSVGANTNAFIEIKGFHILEDTLSERLVASPTPANIVQVQDTDVTSIDDFKGSGGGGGLDESALHSGLDNYQNKDDWKATSTTVDLSHIETKVQADARQSALIAELAKKPNATLSTAEAKLLADIETKTQADARQSALIAELAKKPDETLSTADKQLITASKNTTQEISAGVIALTQTEKDKFKAVSTTVDTSAIASAVRSNLANELARIDSKVSDAKNTQDEIKNAVWNANSRSLTVKNGFSLTENQVTAIATAVETSILDETDGRKVLEAIVGAIGNQNISQVALVGAIRADLERNNGTLKTIESDTNELQSNQDNWNTATGFATPANLLTVKNEISALINALENISKTDVKTALDSLFTKISDKTDRLKFNADNDVIASLDDEAVKTIESNLTKQEIIDAINSSQSIEDMETVLTNLVTKILSKNFIFKQK